MPSRSEMDRPAAVAATVVGVLLIAASLVLLGVFGGGGGKDYAISWSETEAGSSQALSGAMGSTTTLRVPVTNVLASNATIALESCTDGAAAPLSQPATITWKLFAGDDQVDGGSGTASCANDGPFKVALDGHPDVGQASASSPAGAQAKAYGAGDNETKEYRLEFSWSRPASPGGLPLPNPAFSATVSLTVDEWIATANEPGQEVPR